MSTAFQWPILLQRVNGNQSLARRLLTDFFAGHAAVAATLAKLDHAQARLLLHRMGGTAANLGLADLAQACGRGEALAADACDRRTQPWIECVAELEQRFSATHAEVETFLSTLVQTDATAPAALSADRRQLTARLAALLAESDLSALAMGEEWARMMPPGDVVTAVLSAIHALDFATAAQLLQTEATLDD